MEKKDTWRDPQSLVLEAELLAGSPERVKTWPEETAKERGLPSLASKSGKRSEFSTERVLRFRLRGHNAAVSYLALNALKALERLDTQRAADTAAVGPKCGDASAIDVYTVFESTALTPGGH